MSLIFSLWRAKTTYKRNEEVTLDRCRENVKKMKKKIIHLLIEIKNLHFLCHVTVFIGAKSS